MKVNTRLPAFVDFGEFRGRPSGEPRVRTGFHHSCVHKGAVRKLTGTLQKLNDSGTTFTI